MSTSHDIDWSQLAPESDLRSMYVPPSQRTYRGSFGMGRSSHWIPSALIDFHGGRGRRRAVERLGDLAAVQYGFWAEHMLGLPTVVFKADFRPQFPEGWDRTLKPRRVLYWLSAHENEALAWVDWQFAAQFRSERMVAARDAYVDRVKELIDGGDMARVVGRENYEHLLKVWDRTDCLIAEWRAPKWWRAVQDKSVSRQIKLAQRAANQNFQRAVSARLHAEAQLVPSPIRIVDCPAQPNAPNVAA